MYWKDSNWDGGSLMMNRHVVIIWCIFMGRQSLRDKTMKIKIPIKIQVEWNIGFYETRSSNLLWYTAVQPAWHVENFFQVKRWQRILLITSLIRKWTHHHHHHQKVFCPVTYNFLVKLPFMFNILKNMCSGTKLGVIGSTHCWSTLWWELLGIRVIRRPISGK